MAFQRNIFTVIRQFYYHARHFQGRENLHENVILTFAAMQGLIEKLDTGRLMEVLHFG